MEIPEVTHAQTTTSKVTNLAAETTTLMTSSLPEIAACAEEEALETIQNQLVSIILPQLAIVLFMNTLITNMVA